MQKKEFFTQTGYTILGDCSMGFKIKVNGQPTLRDCLWQLLTSGNTGVIDLDGYGRLSFSQNKVTSGGFTDEVLNRVVTGGTGNAGYYSTNYWFSIR